MTSNRYATLHNAIGAASDQALDWFHRRDQLAAESKPGNQFVSEADRDVERLIRGRIAADFPQDRIIGEELGAATGEGDFSWYVDPIDGTSNFLNGLPLWGVSIGVAGSSGPILGALALPVLGVTLIGGVGHPLSDLNGAQIIRHEPPVPTVAMGWNSGLPPEQEATQIDAVRALGFETVVYRCASVSLAWSVMGLVSGFFEARTNSWDIAAGWALHLAAGLPVNGWLDGPVGTQAIAAGAIAGLFDSLSDAKFNE